MKYRIIAPALCVILAFVMSACTNTDMGSAGSVSGQRENTIIEGTENVTIQSEYHTEEISCTNGGEDIYGVAYIPETPQSTLL